MTIALEPIPRSRPTFLNAPRLNDLATLDADVAILGVPYATPYDMAGATFPAAAATRTIRAQSMRYAERLTHYDYDFGSDIFAGRNVHIVDCGDVAMRPGQWDANNAATAAAVRAILARGAVPVVIGGGHEITIPVMRGFDGHGPLYVIQLDAHYDWRDEINGVRDGLSSPMRRASELPYVSGMAQLGIRGVGSARLEEVEAVRAYGSLVVGTEELRRAGLEAVLARIPVGRYYITLDMDGLDPAIAPAVGAPAFGGLSYDEMAGLLRGVAAKGTVVGYDVVVVRPALDVRDMTSLLAARLTLVMLGALAHAGQIGRP